MLDFIPDYVYLFVFGLILLIKGGDWFVDGAQSIAKKFKVPELLIGATVVSIGTTLPEVMTSATSAMTGHGALSLGNIIGANIFNLVLVSGVAITLSPFTVPLTSELLGQNVSFVLDIPVMLAVMLIMTIPAIVKNKLSRWQGIALLSIYVLFLLTQFLFVKPIVA